MGSSEAALLLLLLLLLCSLLPPSTPLGFNCSNSSSSAAAATCLSIAGYVSPNATTLAAVQALFGVKHLRSILGANNLPLSTPPNATVGAQQTVAVPFNCSCSNGTGVSNRRPVYTVRSGDGLDHIAREVFSNLLVYQDIQQANGLPNASFIVVGQKLWVPLPCSCDDVDGQEVVHYAHVVAAGSSVAAIATEFNVSQSTLIAINGIADVQSLQAGQVLDVPLEACASAIRNDSLDSYLRVANGNYVFTANNCVMCTCDAANNWTLHCQPSQLKPSNWSLCPSMQCEGSNLYLGNSTSTSCNRTTCAYAGYTNQTILTALVTDTTCPVSNSFAMKDSFRAFSWNFFLILILPLLSFHHIQ
ncbi:lysM domain-containing GPI-anchored protein 2 [Syzygium oleosum]|uniref:lysM domain-containing GPI-anchored protein 2 n=1 Tax=Syzygium oleosum TaxID=219896 RepID=UPI0011D192F9|nr:lysM domain-containing GPI-anchored protein 2 [Syzygium oleosum]